jgi:hypothetical protein
MINASNVWSPCASLEGNLDSLPETKTYDILTPIRQASNYLFVLRTETLRFLFRFDECAPILQPNLKAGVNWFDTQQEWRRPCVHLQICAVTFQFKLRMCIELVGISFDIWICDLLRSGKRREKFKLWFIAKVNFGFETVFYFSLLISL